jgi:vesicle coat complex subunit
MTAFAALLAGGTLHGVARVVDDVLHETGRFADVIACLDDADPVVRMRAADAAEKITRDCPELLAPHLERLLALAATTEQPSVRWHLAQMLTRVKLSPNQERAAMATFRAYLNDKSPIVNVSALQALADLTLHDPSLRRPVIATIRKAVQSGAAGVRSRGERLLDVLERRTRT